MRLTGDDNGGGGEGALTVVGVKMDGRSKELLTWALVKIARPGDRVVALHVLNLNTEDKGELLSLVKTFDSVLADYEGFCNLKQVDLKFKVCRGSPVRKILVREAKTYRAANLVVGTSSTHHTIRSSVSVAKYCARNVERSVSVIAVNDGKIAFQRGASDLTGQTCHVDVPGTAQSSGGGNESNPLALVPVESMDPPESKPGMGWSLLRRVHLQNGKKSGKSAKMSSLVQRVLTLQSRQSFAAIYPRTDEKNDEIASLSVPKELEDLSKKYASVCKLFSYRELLTATSNFTSENIIGKGGSSMVYKGSLPDGKEVAVKTLKPSQTMVTQFCSEIEILTTLHHKNIISLLGFCFGDSNLLLVYNLLSRGSLEDNLHGTPNVGNTFGWSDRYKVALGIAEALDHLHSSADEPIIHRDVKSSNILLSDDFEPQLSDFGLTTMASSLSCHLESIDVAGTFGYLAPEYLTHGKINEKIDVYAFGIVLLELLSGRKPIDNRNANAQKSLVLWAEEILRGGKATALLDERLVEAYDHDEFERVVLAAKLCINHDPRFRPEINIVVRLLEGEADAIDLARQDVDGSEELDSEKCGINIQSLINLALLNLEDDSPASSSNGQNISVEDYLQGRWSCSSSYD
ncbi:PREDICTED: serine/threonine-protein kinase CDG1-like isoform X2 [Ipomoea nil]|uniref:serine/threonine-protein kinase CDG1-like isoform X2 n=1 Tax=Ipomoea nil TaxID=35883 RepID=UPI000901A6AD|nr:PREDICTED: serine/threonine-protein kinase CDG1-like isoform X2 [Ipomoea nil]